MKKISILFFCCLISSFTFSNTIQDSIKLNPLGKYVGVSGGLVIDRLRDSGTSPLFYTGILPLLQVEYLRRDAKDIFNYKLCFYNGIYFKKTKNDIFKGSGLMFDLELSYLRKLDISNNIKHNHYLGFSLGNFSSIRINEAFMNAAFAFDNFSNVELDYKFELQFIRKERMASFFGFFKYKKIEKKFLLSFDLGLPVYSLIYRPGFNYIGNATSNITDTFDHYEFKSKLISGLNTDISISRLYKNGNIIKYAYCWDMFSTGKASAYMLNTAKHLFVVSLILKLD